MAGQAVGVDTAVPVVEAFHIDREKPEAKYLAAVEWVLEDRHVSPEQQQILDNLQAELQLTRDQVREVHMYFMCGLAASMWTDRIISTHESHDLEMCGNALQLTREDVMHAILNPLGLELINEDYRLQPGARIVFTGEMTIPRSEWVARAKAAGLHIAGSVSGKTDFLVVPFAETGSSKSLRARQLGVAVISEQRFIRMIKRLESSDCSPGQV